MKRNLLWSILLVCNFFVLSAQNLTTVNGKIRGEEENEILPYATISIAQAATPKTSMKRLAADDKGVFSVPLPGGSYIFTFHFVGKIPLNKNILVDENKKRIDIGTIILQEGSTHLSEVSVVAQKPLVKVDLDKLVYSLKDDPESKTSNVLEMLRKVPLVTVDGEDKIRLKGSSSYKVFLNGKPSNMLTRNASQVLKNMPANNIKDIEVITDPGAKYDAEGVDGIINIVTDKKVDEGYSGSVNGGISTLNERNLGGFLTTKYGKWGTTIFASRYKITAPSTETTYYRQDKFTTPETVLNQHSSTDFNGGGYYMNGLVSYQHDQKNLFTISVHGNVGSGKSETAMNALSKGFFNYGYKNVSENTNSHGTMDFSADYQRSFDKKGKLFTVSYQYSHTPNSSDGFTEISDTTGVPILRPEDYRMRNENTANGDEHTGQIDYVNPLTQNHTIEAGLKYIFRNNNSEAVNEYWDFDASTWKEDLLRKNDLKHRQQIASAYGSYSYRYNKFGAKLGLRTEYTNQEVIYINNEFTDGKPVNTYFFNPVPSAALSYQLSMTKVMRLTYAMRILRPGIHHLNPYVNKTNPLNISYGNPDLNAENNHKFSLNYGSFSQRFNMNMTLSYDLTNNAITAYQFVKDGVTHRTYDNIGKKQIVGLDGYFNWRPMPALNIYVNANVHYIDIRSANESALKNNGFSTRAFSGLTYTFPYDIRLGVNHMYWGSNVELQSKTGGFQFMILTLSKSFLKKKLDVSLYTNNPFEKYMEFEAKTTTPHFYSEMISKRPSRSLGIRVSYRFGDLKTQVKKIERGIKNEDIKTENDNKTQQSGQSVGGMR